MSGRLGGRSRWAALGAVAAVLAGGGGLLTASAAGSAGASSFVPITPCRLFDTRAGDINIGPRSTPIGANETMVVPVWGTNGNCVIPTGTTGVSVSVAIINPTAGSFLTVFPADATRPLTSNLNWVAGQAPTPNAVTAALSADGRLGLYNLAGTVDLLVDIVGYYELSTSGPAGPPGDPGPRPSHVVWVATSGGDFTSVSAALNAIGTTLPAASATSPYLIRVAPGTYDEPNGIDLEADVSIEGSGTYATVIQSAGLSAVRGSGSLNNVEVRALSVRSTANVFLPQWNSALRLVDVTGTVTVRDAAFHVTNAVSANSNAIETVSSALVLVNTAATMAGPGSLVALRAGGTSVVRVTGGALSANLAAFAQDAATIIVSGTYVGGFPLSLGTQDGARIAVTASTVTSKKSGNVQCVASFDVNLLALADCPT